MGKKHENRNASLGRAVIKDRFKTNRKPRGHSSLHTTDLDDGYDWNKINLKSVTEENTLDEFLATAELAGTEFTAEKLNYTFVTPTAVCGLLTAEEEKKTKETQDIHRKLLKIPRRPEWDESTTPEELDQAERDAFLEWRRDLAHLQEVDGIIMTPYERNLDFWRQLWRVIERSDVVVQIVDARNPLLFRCEDLEAYVHEVGGGDKLNMVLINKADLLTEKQRRMWADYFETINVRVAFWSAIEEIERIKQEAAAAAGLDEHCTLEEGEEDDEDEEEEFGGTDDDSNKLDNDDDCDDNADEEDDEWTDVSTEDDSTTDKSPNTKRTAADTKRKNDKNKKSCSGKSRNQVKFSKVTKSSKSSSVQKPIKVKNDERILTGLELIDLFKSLHWRPSVAAVGGDEECLTTVGLVGYPNVGKSSTVNAILQTKKVPVSATPGRTKHFQTLYLDPTIMLCDCPGLVMPTFVSTKAEMITNGILPIDQMRDYVLPISLICKQIPRDNLETVYGVMLPLPREEEDPNRYPSAHELLGCHASIRGFMTHKGIPDFQRSARQILKDFVNGKLLFAHPPPGISEEVFESASLNTTKKKKIRPAQSESGIPPAFSSELDKAFFAKPEIRVGSKGVGGVIGFTRKEGYVNHHSPDVSSLAGSELSINGKPWKRHNNAKKKEKLRRLHGDKDA